VWIISHRAMALSFGYGRMPPKKTYPFKEGDTGGEGNLHWEKQPLLQR
jgi:hypothetical protein